MKLHHILSVLIFVAALIVTIEVYPKLPVLMPSHWGVTGAVDGYMPKNANIAFMLGLAGGVPLLMTFLPRLDPKYKNIKEFENDYGWMITIMTAFFVGLYFFTLAWALGYHFPVQDFMIPAMAVLFFTVGNMLKHAKMNYMIGIRVPWTLNSEKNWNMTHQLGAKTFMIGAGASLLTLFFGSYAFVGFLVIIFAVALIPVIYSYYLHTQGI